VENIVDLPSGWELQRYATGRTFNDFERAGEARLELVSGTTDNGSVSSAEHDTVGKVKREFAAVVVGMLSLAMLGMKDVDVGRRGGIVDAREEFTSGRDIRKRCSREWAVVQEEGGLLGGSLNGVIICKLCL
jgi:hypothetical protein